MKKKSIDLGIKLGTLLFIITAIIYIVDINYFSNFLHMLMVYKVPVISFGIYAIINNKKMNNGLISFKEAFTSYFLCIAIGYFIHNLGIIAIFKFIDPGAAEIIVENTMVVMKEWMKSFGATSEMISATMQEMQKNNPYSYFNIATEFFTRLLMNTIFAIPLALMLKKQN